MKIAIVHDDLMRRGGGEQVALSFHQAFPEAPIYTSVYNPELTYPEFKTANIITSWYQRIAKTEKMMKWLFLPFGLMAMKSFKIDDDFDVVLVSTTYSGKYIKVPKNALMITYCYTPFRLAWNPESYSEYNKSKGIARFIFNRVVRFLRSVDRNAGRRVDFFLAMTEETRGRLAHAYQPKNPIQIIPPPVNFDNYHISNKIGDYYLLVSRLEFYKRVDLAIKAFNKLGLRLIIVGRGSKKQELVSMANGNIEFKEGLDSDELSKLYSECKAFIFPQHEDYGITPLEANASGRPVIAYGKGGVLETMIPYKDDPRKATAVFFHEQNVNSLILAVKKTEALSFDSDFIRNNALRFTKELFIEKIRDFVFLKYHDSLKKRMGGK
ncbi:MAG: glycosyltransferase [Cytophagales bacterium]|nr:glycosyltransferase [Cytophagales bacterium]